MVGDRFGAAEDAHDGVADVFVHVTVVVQDEIRDGGQVTIVERP